MGSLTPEELVIAKECCNNLAKLATDQAFDNGYKEGLKQGASKFSEFLQNELPAAKGIYLQYLRNFFQKEGW